MTKTNLERIFTERSNYDLRTLLNGTETQMKILAKSFQQIPQYFLGAYPNGKMSHRARKLIRKSHTNAQPPAGLLFSLVLSKGRVMELISFVAKYSLHSDDILLLINLIDSSTSFNGVESCVPLCLPRFNDTGFMYCYINYISPDLVLLLLSPNKESFFALSEFRNRLYNVYQNNTEHIF
jgi:vacuolar fusion protein MON1